MNKSHDPPEVFTGAELSRMIPSKWHRKESRRAPNVSSLALLSVILGSELVVVVVGVAVKAELVGEGVILGE